MTLNRNKWPNWGTNGRFKAQTAELGHGGKTGSRGESGDTHNSPHRAILPQSWKSFLQSPQFLIGWMVETAFGAGRPFRVARRLVPLLILPLLFSLFWQCSLKETG